jgi:hypothetical protein
MFKNSIVFVLKTIVLTIWLAILFMVGSSTMGPAVAGASLTPEEQNFAGIALIVISLVDTLILAYLILRSRLYGWQLMLVTLAAYYGVKVVISQIETWFFMTNVTPDTLRGIFLMYVPSAILYPPVAVIVWGRLKAPVQDLADTAPNTRLIMPAGQLIAKLAVLSLIVYPLLFFGFGYFVAWKNPEVVAFYHGVDYGSFIAQMASNFRDSPQMYPFEVLRGLIWVGLAAPVIRWTRGRAWEAGLIVALLFSLLMNDVHLYPNPLMPRAVSTTHFIETASSNFIWGFAVTWLMHRAHTSLADLFGRGAQEDRTHKVAPA